MFKNNAVSLRLGWLLYRRPATSTDGLKSHSPPRPPQTPAAQFKRPYRNCPDHTTCAPPHFFFRGSPDRALTFIGTNPENAANFCIARHPPRVAGKHSCNSLCGEAPPNMPPHVGSRLT